MNSIYLLYILLGISILLNIVLFIKVHALKSQLSDVDERVRITSEELSKIRTRLERVKREI
ncbi:hypothetical protein DRP05_06610 [Archaeoglobales archaeon]|nr:MAG: hypothetical protein DRP05_06610 [Archaeoglobales archaeon]